MRKREAEDYLSCSSSESLPPSIPDDYAVLFLSEFIISKQDILAPLVFYGTLKLVAISSEIVS